MRVRQQDTPPSSINGDEITDMDEEGVMYLDEMEEVELEDLEDLLDQEQEDTDMEKPEDLSVFVFNKHSGSVFCCDLHPSGKLAATGGEDDKAYVWSVETGDVVMECTGHKDSVIFSGFSFDGSYLATVDMGGIIKIWQCNLDNHNLWPVVFEYEADDMNWAQWHFGAKVLICAGAAGDIYVFKIPSGETKVLQGHNVRVECGKLFRDGVRLAVGYEDGAIKLWDLKTGTVAHHVPANVHELRVTALDIHPENNLVASISTDGKLVLVTPNNGKVVAQLETENDLEAIAFSPDPQFGYVALGTLNGSVTIWDSTRQMVRSHCAKIGENNSSGVTKMVWIKHHLVTGCLDGSIRIYEGRSGERSQILTGHWSEVLDLSFNEKENLILTTSDDGTARIFKFEIKKDKD